MASTDHINGDCEVAVGADDAANLTSDFSFLPIDLSGKCRTLIESYHEMHGFSGLPDMLWTSEARDIIESDRDLTLAFRRACRSRGARRANETFIAIAAIVMSVEVLARDFAGWGKQFPNAKSRAEKILGEPPSGPRITLMDLYLFPSLTVRRETAHTRASAAVAG